MPNGTPKYLFYQQSEDTLAAQDSLRVKTLFPGRARTGSGLECHFCPVAVGVSSQVIHDSLNVLTKTYAAVSPLGSAHAVHVSDRQEGKQPGGLASVPPLYAVMKF